MTTPMKVTEPHPNDIKCGRGYGANPQHPGNRFYHDRIMEYKQDYKEATASFDQNEIVMSILQAIETLKPPGRFLESKTEKGVEVWYIIAKKKVVKKIKQALRDMKPKKRGSASSRQATSSSHSFLPPTTSVDHAQYAQPAQPQIQYRDSSNTITNGQNTIDASNQYAYAWNESSMHASMPNLSHTIPCPEQDTTYDSFSSSMPNITFQPEHVSNYSSPNFPVYPYCPTPDRTQEQNLGSTSYSIPRHDHVVQHNQLEHLDRDQEVGDDIGLGYTFCSSDVDFLKESSLFD